MLLMNGLGYDIGKLFFLCTAPMVLIFGNVESWAYTTEQCVQCHRERSPKSKLHISIEEYKSSIHGPEIVCVDCHTGVRDRDHEKRKGSGAVDCGQCHKQVNRHGLRVEGTRPTCDSCHTKHGILPAADSRSSVNRKRLSQTCGRCHPGQTGKADFLSWLLTLRVSSHKKQDFGRPFEADDCVGCHQGNAAHGENEPIEDKDCYKCHFTPEGRPALLGYIHADANRGRRPFMFALASVYLGILLLLLTGGFIFFVRRVSVEKNREPSMERFSSLREMQVEDPVKSEGARGSRTHR